jgi:hypothetical protein
MLALKLKQKIKPFYQLILKNKYRRDTQPGLTRYNWDQLSYEHKPFEVIAL